MAGEQLDLEALADACMRRRAAIGGASSAWIKRMDEANRDVDALLAEVRRLRGQVEARDRALDDVSKFMEWRAARRAVETVSINSFVQPGGDL